MNGRLLIKIHEWAFETVPKHYFPEIETPFGSLDVIVDWSNNNGKWSAIKLSNFRVVGAPAGYYQAYPSELVISAGDGGKKSFNFTPGVAQPVKCTFDVSYLMAQGSDVYTLDPVIILKPEGHSGSIQMI